MKKSATDKILLIEDINENLTALQSQLRKPDRFFIKSGSGQEALKILAKEDISLVIIDIKMPGMVGCEVAEKMKSSNRLKNIPILFITDEYFSDEFIQKGFKGAVDYIARPVEPFLLQCKVEDFLKLYRHQLELDEKEKQYVNLFKHANDPIIIHDFQGKILNVNKRSVELTGYSRDDLLKLNILDLKPKWKPSFEDTGIGIPANKMNIIFREFTQADGSSTRKYGGTGLGLSICSQLVKMLEGELWAESVEGEGSTFHFTAKLKSR